MTLMGVEVFKAMKGLHKKARSVSAELGVINVRVVKGIKMGI